MLNTLIDSKSKRRLLNVLFSFPERSFYQNELREISRLSSRTLSLALSELAKEDVIRMFIKKRRKYFQINQHMEWYDELSELVSEEKVVGGTPASKLIKKLRGPKVAILSGVFTGLSRAEADLLLVGSKLNSRALNKLLDDLEKLVGQELNYSVMDQEEYEYRQHMSDRFMRDILDNPHIVVYDKLKSKKKAK